MGVLILSGLPAGTPLSGVFSVGAARANEDPAAFDRSYKESGKLAALLAQRYEGALRQTALRLAEVARQDAGALARNPVAIETSRSPWPIVTYVLNGDRLSLIPEGKAHLSPEDLQGVSGRQPHVFLKGSTVLVTVLDGSNRYTTAEIPLEAFTGPLSSISLGGNSALMLLDDQDRSLGAKPLGSEDQELLKSVSGEAATTLVSKTSVLSLARIPSAGWTVIVRLPLAEAYRGIAMPELDERTLPNPLYLVKRTPGASLEGVGQGILLSFGGLALLVVALLLLRRRLRDPRLKSARMPFAEQGPFSAPLSAAQSGGLAVLEALMDERDAATPDDRLSPVRQVTERRIDERALLPAPAQPPSEGAASGVWRDTLQAEVSYLQAELRKTQDQLKQLAQQPQVGTLQARMESELKEAERRLAAQQEAELREFSEALRQRLDLEARRLEALEQNSRQVLDGLDRKVAQQEGQLRSHVETLQSKYNGLSDALRQRFEQDDQRVAALHAKFDGLSEGLRQRFEQEDQLLASLDREVERTRSEIEALRAQQAGFGQLSESKFGLLESELESYRNQGQQADRQASERIEVLAKALQELHAALGQVQSSNGKIRQEVQAALAQAHQENAKLHEELGTLSARVHRVVQLLAKGRPA
jgi:hypothetical protein